MKPNVSIVATFSRIRTESNTDQNTGFTGKIDLKALKRRGQSEVEVVLVPMESVPPTLAALMNKTGIPKDGLIMFAASNEQEPTTRKKT